MRKNSQELSGQNQNLAQQVEAVEEKVKAKKPSYFYTDPDYGLKEGEENDVHVLIAREFHKGVINNKTVIEMHQTVQIVDPKTWLNCRENWPKQGWIFVKMLHVPYEMPTGFANTVTVAE